MLLKPTLEEVEAVPLEIAHGIAVIPFHLSNGMPTLDLLFQTTPSHTGQPAALRRIRIHPRDLDLFASLVSEMHAGAKDGPLQPPTSTKH